MEPASEALRAGEPHRQRHTPAQTLNAQKKSILPASVRLPHGKHLQPKWRPGPRAQILATSSFSFTKRMQLL